jgi:hypothetical protein
MGIGDVKMVMKLNFNMNNKRSKFQKIKLNSISADMIFNLQIFIV